MVLCTKYFGPLRKSAHSGAATKEEVVEMTDFLARNWISVLVLGGMAFMLFGMHRGHGESGHGGGCGGRANEGHEPAAPTRHESDTDRRPQGSHPEGAVGSPLGSPQDTPLGRPQDTPVPSDSSVQVEDASQEQRPRRGCC